MERYQAWWLGLSGAERATWWLRRTGRMDKLRLNLLRERHPGLSDGELLALWTEETYRDTVDPVFLARVCTAMRTGSTELPPRE